MQHLESDLSLPVRLREGHQLLVAHFLSCLSSVWAVGWQGSWCAVTAACCAVHNRPIDTLSCLWLFVVSTCCLWSELLNPVFPGLLLPSVLSPTLPWAPERYHRVSKTFFWPWGLLLKYYFTISHCTTVNGKKKIKKKEREKKIDGFLSTFFLSSCVHIFPILGSATFAVFRSKETFICFRTLPTQWTDWLHLGQAITL